VLVVFWLESLWGVSAGPARTTLALEQSQGRLPLSGKSRLARAYEAKALSPTGSPQHRCLSPYEDSADLSAGLFSNSPRPRWNAVVQWGAVSILK